jgi:glycosidase
LLRSIPVINKTLPEVQQYFLTGANSVSRYWLKQGASAWRMDVSGDPSFPAGYWETFRQVTKSTRPDALLISETWQKDSTLLRMLRGDRLDTTMNYRLRDAVIGLLTPGPFDSKGFADSGRERRRRQETTAGRIIDPVHRARRADRVLRR